MKQLQTGFLKNEKDAREVSDEAGSVYTEVKTAENQAQNLQIQYREAVNALNQRSQDSGLAHTRAQKLLEKASQLSVNTTAKLKELKGKVITTFIIINIFKSVLFFLSLQYFVLSTFSSLLYTAAYKMLHPFSTSI